MKMESFEMISGVRDVLGKFLGCDRSRVALTPNYSLGLNLVLEGLSKESRVLLLQTDYPSVNWPFESRGFHRHYAKLDEAIEKHIDEQLKTERIDVLAFSLVQWENGLRMDPDFMAYLRAQYPDLLMVADGTQSCGAFAMDFEASGLDVLGGSGYKWMLAGTGNGYTLFSERATDRLKLNTTGFNTVGGRIEEKGNERTAKQLEPGHLDSTCFGSLGFAVEKLMSWGMEHIEMHNQKLMAKAISGLESLGLLNDPFEKRKVHGNILKIRGGDALFNHLSESGVSCSQRGGGIRLSFHLYNSEADIDRLLHILKSAHPSLTTPKN
jgi:selenocysteine lyase/cysteine desulfurase